MTLPREAEAKDLTPIDVNHHSIITKLAHTSHTLNGFIALTAEPKLANKSSATNEITIVTKKSVRVHGLLEGAVTVRRKSKLPETLASGVEHQSLIAKITLKRAGLLQSLLAVRRKSKAVNLTEVTVIHDFVTTDEGVLCLSSKTKK